VRAAPLISVVITAFDRGGLLAQTVRSISSALPAEVIVINGDETDEVADVLASLETGIPVRSVRLHRDAELATARNRGLRESRGDYIVFLDAGDHLTPGALDLGATTLGDHPACAFVSGRCQALRDDGIRLVTAMHPRIARHHYRELLRHNYIASLATVMFRRAVLERVGGFNAGLNGAADYELYLHIARHYPVYDNATVVAECRSEKHANAADMLRETLEVLWSQRPFLEGDEASLAAYRDGQRFWQDLFGTQLAHEIRTAVHEHDWATAISKSAVLAEYYPRGLWHHVARGAHRLLNDMEAEPQERVRAGVRASVRS
jgi:glycosyltransferase involved in cell wall biosynthesis